jgi:hypothetical protein
VDLPYDLYKAVEHATDILHWQENLTRDEIPPEWMWGLDDELEVWFERVLEERDEKFGGGSDKKDTNVPLMDNEYAAEMRKRGRG